MSQGPYPRPFTFEKAVAESAKTIAENASWPRGIVMAAMAFAFSLAYNRPIKEVHEAIKAATLPRESGAYWFGKQL